MSVSNISFDFSRLKVISRDIDLNAVCQEVCAEETLECITNCDPTDTECMSTCLRTEATCVDREYQLSLVSRPKLRLEADFRMPLW